MCIQGRPVMGEGASPSWQGLRLESLGAFGEAGWSWSLGEQGLVLTHWAEATLGAFRVGRLVGRLEENRPPAGRAWRLV